MGLQRRLGWARKIDKEIRELNIALREAKDNAVYQSPAFAEAVQGSKDNRSENKALRVASYAEEIETKKRELEQAKKEIFELIYSLPDSHTEDRAILVAFYVNRKKASEIADEECEDVSGIYKKINKAVKLLEDFI